MTTLHFELPPPLTLSANGRQHWAQKAGVTAALRELGKNSAANAVLNGYNLPTMDRAHLTVRVGWPDNRRRDVANLSPTIKALVDGIVDAGLLPDDDDAHLVGPDLRTWVAGKKGVVVLDFEFTEIGDADA